MSPQQNPMTSDDPEDPATRVRNFIKNKKVDEVTVLETPQHELDWDSPSDITPNVPAPTMFPVSQPIAPTAESVGRAKQTPVRHSSGTREPIDNSHGASISQLRIVSFVLLGVQGTMLVLMFVLIFSVMRNAPAAQWEYLHTRPTQAELNQLGSQGWEIVSPTGDSGYSAGLLLKRRI